MEVSESPARQVLQRDEVWSRKRADGNKHPRGMISNYVVVRFKVTVGFKIPSPGGSISP